MNATIKTETLFAVRFIDDDTTGTRTYEYYMGYDPCVFRDRADAEAKRNELAHDAETIDWGHPAPKYYVEETTADQMWSSEEIAVPDSHTMGDADGLVVRTDNGTGAEELCDWSRAEEMICNEYYEPAGVLRQLSLGHPVRCTFATYQHRDFVPGFER